MTHSFPAPRASARFRTGSSVLLAALAIAALSVPALRADVIGLVLPTDNTAIFSDDPSKFYMYTDRNFEGVRSRPWQGGTYGFSRNQKRTPIGIVMTRFHGGIDIAPTRRDASGNPLDDVRSIAAGTVVYVSDSPSASNYGRYLVVHHDWGEGPFFSLYAHLNAISAKTGQQVRAGEVLGRMGFTGVGINRERSHLHLELNFLLSDHFQRWFDRHFTSANRHGIFNGINQMGVDIASLYLQHHANPNITMAAFLATKEVHYKVLVPRSETPPFLLRYPFLGRELDSVRNPRSWEFSFADTGVPLAIRPDEREISSPVVTYVKPSQINHSDVTSGRLTGTGSTAQLTAMGSRYIQLISDTF